MSDCPYRNDEGHVAQRCPNCSIQSHVGQINQCDGCQRGLPFNKYGHHFELIPLTGTLPCTKDRSVPFYCSGHTRCQTQCGLCAASAPSTTPQRVRTFCQTGSGMVPVREGSSDGDWVYATDYRQLERELAETTRIVYARAQSQEQLRERAEKAESALSAIQRMPGRGVRVEGPLEDGRYDLYLNSTFLGRFDIDAVTPLANAIGTATGEYEICRPDGGKQT